MRIIALPLYRVKVFQGQPLLVYYHFDLLSPCRDRGDPPWHKKVLNNVTNKAVDIWTRLGKAPKGSWKLWTYELGERISDQIEFEEVALRNVDPSLGPTVPPARANVQVDDVHSCPKIPLIYPPSLYGADPGLHPPIAHLQKLLASRALRHRRGFYLWMLISPLTVPVTLIPVIPNLPLFYCVWRSWSHYRAYRSSQYLSSLINHGLVEPKPSLELDQLYGSFTATVGNPKNLSSSTSSKRSETVGNVTSDGKSESAAGTRATGSGCIFPNRKAMPHILEMFRLPESVAVDIFRATDQAQRRLNKSSAS